MAIFLSEPPQWTYLTSSLQKCKRKTLLCLYHMLGVNLLQESPKTWSSDPHIWEALPQSHHLTTIKSKARESLPFFCSSCLCLDLAGSLLNSHHEASVCQWPISSYIPSWYMCGIIVLNTWTHFWVEIHPASIEMTILPVSQVKFCHWMTVNWRKASSIYVFLFVCFPSTDR